MKSILLLTTCLAFATTAHADGPSAPIIAVAPVVAMPAPTTDWSGLYAGGQYSSASGTVGYINNGIEGNTYDASGDIYGVFAGYNFQNGNLVYGGELAYSLGEVALDAFPTYVFENMLDVKARVGYAFGALLPYATVGYSMTEWTNGALYTPVSAAGVSYGVGVDYQFSGGLFVGLEYLMRDLVADSFVELPTSNIESDYSTISVRLGYTF